MSAVRAPGRTALRFEWLDRLDDVERLEPHWRALEGRARERMVFGTFDYVTTWYRHHAEVEGSPLVGTAWRGSDLEGLLPLAFRDGSMSRVPVRRADSACHDGEAGDLLVSDHDEEAVVSGLVESLFSRGGLDVALLNGLVPGSAGLRAVEAAAARLGLGLEKEHYRYATIDLSQGYEAYERSLGTKRRGNLRRRLKRAESMGGVSVDRVRGDWERDADTIPDAMHRVYSIAERSWKAREGDPMQERYRRFYADIAARFASQGRLDLSFLKVGGRDAAFILGLRDGGVFYDVTISYVEEFRDVSPGILLMQEVARRLPDEGVRLVVSHGDHDYKNGWASGWEPQVRAVLFSTGLRGRLGRFARFRIPAWMGRRKREAG